MKKFIYSAIALCAMAFTVQNVQAQLGPQLVASVSSIDLGTVEVGQEIPVEFDLSLVNLGSITPSLTNLNVESKLGRIDVIHTSTTTVDPTTWKITVVVKPLEPGFFSDDNIQIDSELPVILIPSIKVGTEIPVTFTGVVTP